MDSATAKTVADFLLADFDGEIPTTIRVLEAVPAGRLDYRPDSTGKTGLGLLRHLALEDEWLLNSIANGAFAAPPDDGDGCGVSNPAEAVARYREKVPAALDRVRAMSPEALAGPINFFNMMNAPAVSYISLALKHSVHHRGQLSAYLRAMGGKVPGIYGPSADTQSQ